MNVLIGAGEIRREFLELEINAWEGGREGGTEISGKGWHS